MSDDDIWKKRFFALMLVRLAGTALALLGLVIASGKLIQPEGHRIIGVALLIVGMIVLAIVPRQMSRRWRRP